MKSFIKINENDNVAVALRDLSKGEPIDIDERHIVLKEDIKRGHKIAIQKIMAGENVIKYGFPIGWGTVDIMEGEWVHCHNVKTNLKGIDEYSYNPDLSYNNFKNSGLTFKGYKRSDGSTGIRNELWIIPTVGCINGTADKIIESFKKEIGNIEVDYLGVLKHNYGCSQLGDDHINTRTILCNLVKHPNAGGVLVLGLGCENNNMEQFKKSLNSFDEKRVRFLVAQEVSDEVQEGVRLLKELYENMKSDFREEVPISELNIGLKCGGSDGLSGITANPLIGKFTDFLTSQGGTAVLTEVPEMFGAETLLMGRAQNREVFNKIVHLINSFKDYFVEYNQPIYENPSPGNKAGGITTLEDKSLGCTQKAGSAPVMDVLKYGETIKVKGLNLLSAPGNDLVASSALAAAGCQAVLFTTGRGTPFGSVVPTVKISTNTQLFKTKPHWIDFNAGSLIEDVPMDDLLKKLVEYVISIANGELTNSERNGCRELAIFKTGVTL